MFDFLDNLVANPLWMIILLIGGFILLVKGADWLVDGASGMAKRWGVSDLVIGLTVVAFGTSMPEFVVNIISATSGSSELAITNILGSNAINIFVILGLTAMIWPVSSKPQSRKDILVAFVASVLVLFFACYTMPKPWNWHIWEHFHIAGEGDYISRIGGSVLAACFVAYMVVLFFHSKDSHEDMEEVIPMAIWKALVLVLVGLVGLTFGGECIVKSATQMARNMGLSDAIIGLTVVALGTSLPELATSCMAAAKQNSDLALGNCVGSCIFNVFFVLGITACVQPLGAYDGIVLDAFLAFLGPAILLLFVMCSKHKRINRWEGASLLLIYGAYLTYRLLTL